eukprot:m.228751 g.228751  ORF g.228751 m.228751 type:complete len:128 (+) comp15982_c0_seq9:762-1145(+)
MDEDTTGADYEPRANSKFLINAYSGIVLTDLQPLNFWIDKLGIVPADVCENPTMYSLTYNGGSNTAHLPDFNWSPGVNCTTQLFLLDGAVQKTTDYFKVPSSIAGTYYSLGNFTSGTSEDSMDIGPK